jgi:hypothetical protein
MVKQAAKEIKENPPGEKIMRTAQLIPRNNHLAI